MSSSTWGHAIPDKEQAVKWPGGWRRDGCGGAWPQGCRPRLGLGSREGVCYPSQSLFPPCGSSELMKEKRGFHISQRSPCHSSGWRPLCPLLLPGDQCHHIPGPDLAPPSNRHPTKQKVTVGFESCGGQWSGLSSLLVAEVRRELRSTVSDRSPEGTRKVVLLDVTSCRGLGSG